jgi:hypothetical protein
MVVFLSSWQRIGEDAIDVAESLFLNLCRHATARADLQARLSVSVFAACWSDAGAGRHPAEVLAGWLPMEVATPIATVPIGGAWFALDVSPQDNAHDVFDRVAAEVEKVVQALPEDERDDPLAGGWDRQG